jgi:polygalacturonase
MKGLIFFAGCGLALLAASLTMMAASPSGFCVNDFGAKADGLATNTAAIQQAIDAAAAAGGVVTFHKGTYLSGAIFLKSNVQLQLQKGVVLRAIQDDALYPERLTRVAGIEMPWPAALVNVYGQTNVTISGQGIIDGNGEYWWRKYWGADGEGGMLKDYRARSLRWAADYDCKRVRAVAVYGSKDVAIRDVGINRSGFWSLALIYSGPVTVDGVNIEANVGGRGPSTDGIDIDSSHDILIQNCTVDCNDDDICLKSGRDADGLRVNRPTENVIIRNCVTRAGGGMITIGSETSGGIRNVEVSNIKAYGTASGIRFKSARSRGGIVENIFIHDIRMEGVENPLSIELNWNPAYSYAVLPPGTDTNHIPAHWLALSQKVEPPERGLPEFRNIVISNLTATAAAQAIYVNAYSEKPIHDVRLEQVRIEAKKPGVISHAANWTMKDVVFATPAGSNIRLVDVQSVGLPRAVKAKPMVGEAVSLHGLGLPQAFNRCVTRSSVGFVACRKPLVAFCAAHQNWRWPGTGRCEILNKQAIVSKCPTLSGHRYSVFSPGGLVSQNGFKPSLFPTSWAG